jgi:threonine aldolase
MFCLSKGLSCPVGSVVVGTREFIDKARKVRKVLGGGMRQAGIIAAPGIVALEKMIDRLKEDHTNAKRLAEGISKIRGVAVDMERVQTNMVIFDISDLGVADDAFLSKLKEKGVCALTTAQNKVRLVTHRGIEKEHITKAVAAIANVADELAMVSHD